MRVPPAPGAGADDFWCTVGAVVVVAVVVVPASGGIPDRYGMEGFG